METGFAIALQILMLLVMLVPPILMFAVRLSPRAPIEIVVNVVKGVQHDRQDLGHLRPEQLANPSDIANLRIAERYYRTLESEIREETEEQTPPHSPDLPASNLPLQRDDLTQFPPQLRSTLLRRLLEWVAPFASTAIRLALTVGGTVFVGVFAIAIIQYLVTHVAELLARLVDVLPYLLLYGCGAILVVWLLDRVHKTREPVLQYAYGSAYLGTGLWSAREISERHRQVCLMLNEIDKASTPQVDVAMDPDILRSEVRNTPLVPGITEIILSHDQSDIQEMRRRLNMVGLFHWRLAIGSSAAFFVSLAVSVYAAIFMESKAFGAIFGGLGLGVVLGTFTYFMLKNVRTSNIAISLFDSYLMELRSSLDAAERLAAPDQVAKAKSKGWLEFRRGLNALWKMERAEKPPIKK
jgi:hypothetical protein